MQKTSERCFVNTPYLHHIFLSFKHNLFVYIYFSIPIGIYRQDHSRKPCIHRDYCLVGYNIQPRMCHTVSPQHESYMNTDPSSKNKRQDFYTTSQSIIVMKHGYTLSPDDNPTDIR